MTSEIIIRTENGLTVTTITHGKSYDVPKIDDIYRFIDYRFKFT